MRAVAKWTISFLGFLLAGLAPAHAGGCEKPVARLVSLQGVVETHTAAETAWLAASLHTGFCPGDTIRTGARSRAAVVLLSENIASETIVRLDQLTTLTLSGLTEKPASWIDLLTGAAHFITRTPRALKIKTPYVNAAVEGTEFVVRSDRDLGSVTVIEGRVLAENSEGSVRLVSGQSAEARGHQAPVMRLGTLSGHAVQWSVYYPPLFDARALSGSADWAESARRSAQAYLAGDTTGAFAAIAALPESIADAGFYNYRAGLLLAVGRLDEAQADIAHSLNLAPDNAHAMALQSVVALARNDKSSALALARKANAHDGESVPAWVALSYAQQSSFDLDAARASTEQALSRDPGNVLVLARLSELWLSLGDLDRALDTAYRAVAINPNIARTQTVLGFAHLTRIKTSEARQAFEKAINLDSADPLPRLGLGLALIRTGQLEIGRRDIEIAAALDPDSSLIRSYLGKAYYEEKRSKLVGPQLAMAKALDPNDPTPWFYDAIRLQSENRPVEALNDLQKSVELNNNRAVYRSRLLLDQDIAARSSSLARIYQDLGFQQRALVESWKSVGTDPASFSAHRFMADSYAALPRHEIARVSELLQSQLLAPQNIYPIQAQSAQTNLAILDGAGPSALGYGEYNPLFVRDGVTSQVNVSGGSQETTADDVIVSGIAGRTSASLGQFHYDSAGFRPNNDLTHNDYDAFLQYALTPGVNVQAEYRQQQADAGDLLYNLDVFNPNQRKESNAHIGRFGLHYKPSVDSDVIASVIYNRYAEKNTDSGVVFLFGADRLGELFIDTDSQSYTGELQYIRRSASFNLITGIGHFDENRTDVTTRQVSTLPPLPPSVLFYDSTPAERPGQQSSAYTYGYLKQSPSVTWTLGLSYEAFDNKIVDDKVLNPKLGVFWMPLPATTVRAAWFKTLKRPLVANQTIEPTQVAGFNQFFDDGNGSKTRRFGVALDQVFTSAVFGGLEGSRRRIESPFLLDTSGTNKVDDQDEQLYRSYLNWTPTKRVALTAEYYLERFAHDGSTLSVETHRAPLGVGYFHPNGVFSRLGVSWVDQTVLDDNGAHTDKFWLTDLTMGYRLANRRGLVSFTVKNLFDEQFSYYGVEYSGIPRTPLFQPGRAVFGQVALTF